MRVIIYLLIYLLTSTTIYAMTNSCKNILLNNPIAENDIFYTSGPNPAMEMTHPKFPNKTISTRVQQSLPLRITPNRHSGKVRTIVIKSENIFDRWPTWEIQHNGVSYLMVNIGFNPIKKIILEFHKIYQDALRSDGNDIIEIKLSKELEAKLETLQKIRWGVYSKVMNSYEQTKSEYLTPADIFDLRSFDSINLTSDVFVLLEKPEGKSSISSMDIANNMMITLQVSYKNNGFINFSALSSPRDNINQPGLLPFESRIMKFLFENNLTERISDSLGDVSPMIQKHMQMMEKVKDIAQSDNIAELTRYTNNQQTVEKEVSKFFVNFVINQAKEHGADVLLASGDHHTTRLFSMFYGFKFLDHFRANWSDVPESISYLETSMLNSQEWNSKTTSLNLTYGTSNF